MYSLPREIHREILSWLEPEEQQVTRLTNRYFAGLIQPRDVNLLRFGARRGLLEYCEIGLSRGNSKWNICETAAIHGQLEVLQWARSQGCLWDSNTCAQTARKGHLEVLQWARSNGCSWNAWTCFWAALEGHLEVLKWARSQGCPWDSDVCFQAAKNGHLEVLQWAVENGCPWHHQSVVIALYPQNVQGYITTLRK